MSPPQRQMLGIGAKPIGMRSAAMPRFFFHLHDDVDLPDPDGSELPDLAAARERANAAALDVICGVLKAERRLTLHHRIDIEDEHHRVVETVRFGDLVAIVS
jgi:hypothetical protein